MQHVLELIMLRSLFVHAWKGIIAVAHTPKFEAEKLVLNLKNVRPLIFTESEPALRRKD